MAGKIDEVKLIQFNQNGDSRGHLVVIEGRKDVPFDIKRVFYIYGSDPQIIRGQHANRMTEFVLVNVSGASTICVDDGFSQKTFRLERAHQGIYLPTMVWKEMYEFSSDSVLLCLASTQYNPDEYIRDHDQFLASIQI